MTRFLLLVGLAVFAACGGASMQTVQLVNKTPRTIEQIFIFPPGKDHGASKAKLVHDDNTRETPEASLTIELRNTLELVFYDSNAVPAGIDRPNTRGITFMIRPPAKKEEPEAPEAPAPPAE